MVPLAHPFFFFNDTATTEIYTLSLHDALPISQVPACEPRPEPRADGARVRRHLLLAPLRPRDAARGDDGDRKSTRLNSSHSQISYAVFCLKKKNKLPPATRPSQMSAMCIRSLH